MDGTVVSAKLALDPGDPLGALCTLDYLALRAGQHDWLAGLAAARFVCRRR